MNSYVPHSQLRFTMRFQHHLFTKPCAVQFSYGVAPNNPRARGQQFQLVSSTINVRQAPKCWQAFSTWFGRRHPVFIVTTVTVNSLWMVSCGKKSAWLIKAMAFRHGCFESCQSDIRQVSSDWKLWRLSDWQLKRHQPLCGSSRLRKPVHLRLLVPTEPGASTRDGPGLLLAEMLI